MDSANNSRTCIWTLLCLLTLCSQTEARPADNIFDFDTIINRTTETFYKIYDPIANYTKDFVGNISTDGHDGFHINNNSLVNITEDRLRNCSIVIGGALAGAGIGVVTFLIGVPLVLCLFGFTCWGIMAGSAAACCQSGIGNVPAGSCFSCVQSLGAGGCGCTYLIIACIVGIPPGLYAGGLYAETYVHCFTSP